MTARSRPRTPRRGPGGEVAIIGMACIFPGAPDLDAYWQNIVSGFDAVTDVPPGRWDPEVFFDPDSPADDRIYCKRGGYLRDLWLSNSADYGVMPVVVDGGEAEQFLSLGVAREALLDAGYGERPFSRERTEVILGRGNYLSRGHANALMYTLGIEQTLQVLRSLHPEYSAQELEAIKGELKASLPHFGPDTAASLIPNFTTGRIANRMDLMGVNFTVDAACASALIAADMAVRDILSGRCDLALVGGVHVATHVQFLAVFSQINALSRRSQIRPFDVDADGTLSGEGVGVAVLKRREDAERDGDRVYAVIKGVGTASDGRGQGLLTPRVEGEELALRRAYEMARVSPETVELIEAHGTGTPIGDLTEIQALTRVFGQRRGLLPRCAIGSVKSMIGHPMAAAGIAGLIKTALALHHKVLPPTLHCDRPNPKFDLGKTPFYMNTEARPWVHGGQDAPRRAGVNSFGFGGINAHVILEEYPSGAEAKGPSRPLHWETEVCLLQGDTREGLLEQVSQLERYLDAGPEAHLKDLAYTLNSELRENSLRLAIVAGSLQDLRQKLAQARDRLADPGCRQIKDVRGIYFFQEPLRRTGKLAFLFPGEASQYPNMLKDLCLHFPEVRTAFDMTDQLCSRRERALLPSQCIYPIPGASAAERSEMERRLWEMGGALEAILTANLALQDLLGRLEIRPDIILGHSSGEFSALVASGMLESDALLLQRLAPLSDTYERLAASGGMPQAALMAVGADRSSVTALLREMGGKSSVAMDNCPHQVVVAGSQETIERAAQQLQAKGIVCQRLPFNRAYHTPPFAAAAQPLREFLESLPLSAPRIETYSCSTIGPYPRDPQEIRKVAVEVWSRPVEFRRTIEVLYEAGARIFVEVGPRGNLTAFVEDILRGRPHLAMGCDVLWRSGITQLNHLIGVLAAHGVSVRLDYLYELRSPRRLRLDEPTAAGDGRGKQALSLPVPLDLPTMRLAPGRAKSLASHAPEPASEAMPAAAQGAEGSMDLQLGPEVLPIPKGLRQAAADHMPLGAASHLMREHLRTMERFLAVEQEVMEAFLNPAGETPPVEIAETPTAATVATVGQPPTPNGGREAEHQRPTLDTGPPSFPFVGTVISLTPGRETVVRRRIDPEEDAFLRDHSFGIQQVSDVDEALRPLPVLPFTICIEIMAEAAALLMPGRVLTAVRQVEVRQWVEVATPITLEITARRRNSGEEVDVQIRTLIDATDTEGPGQTPVAEGVAVFGGAYPQPVPPSPLTLLGERPCRYTAERMYGERLMFHGPRFQGVASLDQWGENGMAGHLQVLPAATLFRSTATPQLLTDPLLMDAAGQLLGYWASERFDAGYVMFPFHLAAVELYGAKPAVGARIRCQVEIEGVTPHQIRATMQLLSPDGRLLLRLVGWEDWRFYWPREFYDFLRLPKEHLSSEAWETPISRFPPGETFACQRVSPTAEMTRAIVMRTVAHVILSRAERQQWEDLRGPESRRSEWLFGRAAAKDAVRRLLKQQHDLDVRPADIEIGQDQEGRPFASVFGLGESAVMPSLSLSHSDSVAVALAGYCSEGQRPGIDIQRVRPRGEGFQQLAFGQDELSLLHSLAHPAHDEWITRLWCAKEAVAKALGKGLAAGPQSLRVRSFDTSTGTVEMILGEKLRGDFPALAGAVIVVYTGLEGGWAVASTLCERR